MIGLRALWIAIKSSEGDLFKGHMDCYKKKYMFEINARIQIKGKERCMIKMCFFVIGTTRAFLKKNSLKVLSMSDLYLYVIDSCIRYTTLEWVFNNVWVYQLSGWRGGGVDGRSVHYLDSSLSL